MCISVDFEPSSPTHPPCADTVTCQFSVVSLMCLQDVRVRAGQLVLLASPAALDSLVHRALEAALVQLDLAGPQEEVVRLDRLVNLVE